MPITVLAKLHNAGVEIYGIASTSIAIGKTVFGLPITTAIIEIQIIITDLILALGAGLYIPDFALDIPLQLKVVSPMG